MRAVAPIPTLSLPGEARPRIPSGGARESADAIAPTGVSDPDSGSLDPAKQVRIPARRDRFGTRSAPPLPRLSERPFSTVLLVIYSTVLALGLGFGSAWWMLSGDYPFGVVTIGAWKAAPGVGSPKADPYSRAILTRRGDVSLAIGEGLALSARVDSAGRALDSACSYRIGTTTPQSRLWTLTLYDSAGLVLTTELGRSGFTSSEILRDQDGRFTIELSRQARSGNWLQLPASGPFTMMLRRYDTPASAASASLDAASVPSIERLGCGS
jgi:hypothetical protein